MESAHLRVDLDELRHIAEDLAVLREQFEKATVVAGESREAVGHSGIGDSLEHFTTNWRRHRGRLSISMRAVESMAQQGHDAYREADQQLTGVLLRRGPQSTGEPPSGMPPVHPRAGS